MNCKVSPRNYRNTLVDASRHTHQTLYYEGPRGKAELKVTEVVTSSKLKGVELTESHHVEAYRSMDQCFCPKKRKELVLFGECECRGSLLNFLESRPVKLSVSSENRKYKGSKARLLVESTSSGSWCSAAPFFQTLQSVGVHAFLHVITLTVRPGTGCEPGILMHSFSWT